MFYFPGNGFAEKTILESVRIIRSHSSGVTETVFIGVASPGRAGDHAEAVG